MIKSDILFWILVGNFEDIEEYFVWEEKFLGDFSSKSSIFSIFFFKLYEDFNILIKVYFILFLVENNIYVGVSEKGKKVIFYYYKIGIVK